MISDKKGLELHDRFSLGKPLTDEEKVLLEKWYAQKDDEEAQYLKLNAPTEDDLEALREQVKLAMQNVALLAEKMQEISANKEALRKQNEELKQQVMQLLNKKAA